MIYNYICVRQNDLAYVGEKCLMFHAHLILIGELLVQTNRIVLQIIVCNLSSLV